MPTALGGHASTSHVIPMPTQSRGHGTPAIHSSEVHIEIARKRVHVIACPGPDPTESRSTDRSGLLPAGDPVRCGIPYPSFDQDRIGGGRSFPAIVPSIHYGRFPTAEELRRASSTFVVSWFVSPITIITQTAQIPSVSLHPIDQELLRRPVFRHDRECDLLVRTLRSAFVQAAHVPARQHRQARIRTRPFV